MTFGNFRSLGEETVGKEVFEDHVMYLQEKANEKEQKRDDEKVTLHLIICEYAHEFVYIFSSLSI